MLKRLDDLTKRLPTARRAKIEKRTKRAVERVALSQLRKLAGITQTELARRMGVRQPTLSQIESQSDMKISTLAGMVASLGGKMRIVVDLPQGEFVISECGLSRGSTTPGRPGPFRMGCASGTRCVPAVVKCLRAGAPQYLFI